jgi:hypothetical protein
MANEEERGLFRLVSERVCAATARRALEPDRPLFAARSDTPRAGGVTSSDPRTVAGISGQREQWPLICDHSGGERIRV